MASQVNNGKAFEWAIGLALTEHGLTLTETNSATQNEDCYYSITSKKQILFMKNARLAIAHILDKESISSGSFEFLPDSRGEDGDVRDVETAWLILQRLREVCGKCSDDSILCTNLSGA